jgi:hypothetical protein
MFNKYCLLISFYLLVILPLDVFGSVDDSIHKKPERFINFSPNLILGDEVGLQARVEYEDQNIGKFMLNGELSFLSIQKSEYLFLDAGFGYGYPVMKSATKTLFFNGFLSFSGVGGFEIDMLGPSIMAEMEYRKSYKNYLLSISPFYRSMLLFPKWHSGINNVNSLGLRVGLVYCFPLSK